MSRSHPAGLSVTVVKAFSSSPRYSRGNRQSPWPRQAGVEAVPRLCPVGWDMGARRLNPLVYAPGQHYPASMTRRDEIKAKLIGQLTQELGAVSGVSTEFTEELDLTGTINGKSIRAVVTKYPRGENPETYDGHEKWTVQLFGGEGQELERFHNPEDSLELAFQMIDWERVEERLNES